MLAINKTKQHMLKELRRSLDARQVLHEVAPKVATVTGFDTADKVGKIRFIYRILGYDLYAHIRCRLRDFKEEKTISGIYHNFLYLPLNRLVLDAIVEYGLWKEDSSSPKIHEHIERLRRLATRAVVHEFVHHVDVHSNRLQVGGDIYLTAISRLQSDLSSQGYSFEDIAIACTNVGFGRLAIREIIAIGATSIVLGEPMFFDLLESTRRHYSEVRTTALSTFAGLSDLASYIDCYDFILDNRYPLTYLFLDTLFSTLHDHARTIHLLLQRPPTLREFLNPSDYIANLAVESS
jgi:hypothetical protein